MIFIMAAQRATARKSSGTITPELKFTNTIRQHYRSIKINQAWPVATMGVVAGGACGLCNMAGMQGKRLVGENTAATMASVAKRIAGGALRSAVTADILANEQRGEIRAVWASRPVDVVTTVTILTTDHAARNNRHSS